MNNTFQLPQSITSVGTYFCEYMFEGCSRLRTGIVHFFTKLALMQNILNRSGVYAYTFRDCSSLTEDLPSIPQLQEIPNTRRYTFQGSPAELIASLHDNWK